jgi:hypothetical protein
MGFRPKRHGVTFLFFFLIFSLLSFLHLIYSCFSVQCPCSTSDGPTLPSPAPPPSSRHRFLARGAQAPRRPSPLGPELHAGSLRRGARAPCRFSPLRDPNSASVFTAGGSSSVPSHGGKRRSRGRGSKRAARFVPLGLWISCFLHFT